MDHELRWEVDLVELGRVRDAELERVRIVAQGEVPASSAACIRVTAAVGDGPALPGASRTARAAYGAAVSATSRRRSTARSPGFSARRRVRARVAATRAGRTVPGAAGSRGARRGSFIAAARRGAHDG